jgi:LCP family protein required for cell wall assembly
MSEHRATAGARRVAQSRRGSGGRRRGVNHQHTVAKVITVALVTLALGTAGAVVTIYERLNGNLDIVSVDRQLGDRPEKGPEGPLNVLVMGSDARTSDPSFDGTVGPDAALSDTTILLHLSADRNFAYAVSIPRDTLVDRPICYAADGREIPGAELVQWNHAFAVGGPACTIRQFEQVSGVRVDNYAVIDFTGFKAMTEAIGGVEVCIPETIDDRAHEIYLEAGTREIKGAEALDYVRVRHVGDGTDPNRIKRQQAFMAAMMNKVVSGGMLSRPDRLVSFLNAATKAVQTDVESIGQMVGLADEFEDVGLGNIQFVTTPWAYSTAQQGRVEWTSEVEELWTVIREDRPLPEKFLDDALSAADSPDGSNSPTKEESGEEPNETTEPAPGATDPASPAAPSESPTNGDPSEEPRRGLSDAARARAGLCA